MDIFLKKQKLWKQKYTSMKILIIQHLKNILKENIKNKKFYPNLTLKTSLANLWKEDVVEGCKSWKELYQQIKNFKLRYRVPLESCDFSRFQMFSKPSLVFINQYVV